MRKKTINHLADTIFWYILYFLPIIAYLFYMLSEPSSGTTSVVNFVDFINSMGFTFLTDNIIITSLTSIFGQGGIFPLFTDSTIFVFFAYYISVYIIHLAVDVLLFIPKLAHKWLKGFTQGE